MGTQVKATFRPLKFVWQVTLIVFIAFNAPWFVTVAAALMAVDVQGRR